MITADEVLGLLGGGERDQLETWVRLIIFVLHKHGLEIVPQRCPKCDRFLSLMCAVDGQIE